MSFVDQSHNESNIKNKQRRGHDQSPHTVCKEPEETGSDMCLNVFCISLKIFKFIKNL